MDSIPDGCGYIIYDVGLVKSGDIAGTTSIYCAACSPGYKPTFDSNGVLTTCTAVLNCDFASNQNIFYNKCGACETGFVFSYTSATKTVDYTSCVETTETNCYAYDATATSCAICQAGYYLNSDKYCDTLLVPKCNTNSFNDSKLEVGDTGDISLHISRAWAGHGCTSCQTGYTGFRASAKSCFQSTYLELDNLPETTAYIQNCKNYAALQSVFSCKICNTNYIPNSTYSACVQVSLDLKDCLLASSTTACHTCVSPKVLVNSKCSSVLITNCQVYNQGTATLECSRCKDEYYLSSNACTKGEISNCGVYTSQTVCASCKP